MAGTSVNMDLDRLKSYNESVIHSKEAIVSTGKQIDGSISELKQYIKGDQVFKIMNMITEKKEAIDAKMAKAFEELTQFLNNQIAQYSAAAQNAGTTLKDVLNFINNNF